MSQPTVNTPAVSRTEKELREAILEQTARVGKLRSKPEIEEATRELVSLKEEYRTVTGSEWSDLREEGPIHHQQSQGTGGFTGVQRKGQTTP